MIWRRSLLQDILAPALMIVALLVAWQIATSWYRVPAILLPAPAAVLSAAITHAGLLPWHLAVTLFEAAAGLAIAVLAGIPIAASIMWTPLLRRTIYPLVLASQSVPKVALAPLFLIWVGYGITTKVVIAASVAVFPIIIDTVTGMAAVETDLIDLIDVLNASRLQSFLKVRLPSAMPYFFSGAKVAATLAVIGAIVGEFVGSEEGLGYLILVSGSQLNTAMVFVALILLAGCGMVLFWLVEGLQRLVCPWSIEER